MEPDDILDANEAAGAMKQLEFWEEKVHNPHACMIHRGRRRYATLMHV